MLFLTHCVMTLGLHFTHPKCEDVQSVGFLLAWGCVTVFGQVVETLTNYKYFWILLPFPLQEVFTLSLLSICLEVTSCPDTCFSFAQCTLDWLMGISFMPFCPPLPQPHHYFRDVQVSGVVTNKLFHAPLVWRAEAKSWHVPGLSLRPCF